MAVPETAAIRKHALAFIAITLLLDTIGFGLIMPVSEAACRPDGREP